MRRVDSNWSAGYVWSYLPLPPATPPPFLCIWGVGSGMTLAPYLGLLPTWPWMEMLLAWHARGLLLASLTCTPLACPMGTASGLPLPKGVLRIAPQRLLLPCPWEDCSRPALRGACCWPDGCGQCWSAAGLPCVGATLGVPLHWACWWPALSGRCTLPTLALGPPFCPPQSCHGC